MPLPVMPPAGQVCAVHGDLRDPVHVDQHRAVLSRRAYHSPACRCPVLRRRTPPTAAPGRRRSFRVGAHQLVEGGGRLVEDRHPLPGQEPEELHRRARHLERHDHQASAVQQRTPYLHTEKSNAKEWNQDHTSDPSNANSLRTASKSRTTLPCGTTTPLGVLSIPTCRSHTRPGLPRAHPARAVRRPSARSVGRARTSSPARPAAPVGEDDHRPGVRQHRPDAVRRILRIPRHVGAAGLQYGEHRDHDSADRPITTPTSDSGPTPASSRSRASRFDRPSSSP